MDEKPAQLICVVAKTNSLSLSLLLRFLSILFRLTLINFFQCGFFCSASYPKYFSYKLEIFLTIQVFEIERVLRTTFELKIISTASKQLFFTQFHSEIFLSSLVSIICTFQTTFVEVNWEFGQVHSMGFFLFF